MTYVAEQTSSELRAHMRQLKAMPGFHEPLAERLYAEVIALDAAALVPIDMVLYCPRCQAQHIDKPEQADARKGCGSCGGTGQSCEYPECMKPWTNPPHRSHLCHQCKHVWRPADVPTNGVAVIKTTGKDDSPSPTYLEKMSVKKQTADDQRALQIGRAVTRACEDLPMNALVTIRLEAGSGTVSWSDDIGLDRDITSYEEPFGVQINAAIDQAIAS